MMAHSCCRAANAPLMLGALTLTEVRAALAAGADVVKVFPASSAGGPGCSAIGAPQARQNRAASGLTCPHAAHAATPAPRSRTA